MSECMGIKYIYIKTPAERHTRRWEDNIKVDLEKVG